MEGQTIYNNEFVMVGNEDNGHLLKVSITNSSNPTDYSLDSIKFTDQIEKNADGTPVTYTSSQTAEGTGSVLIDGKSYGIKYQANDPSTHDDWNITLDYPDSSVAGQIVVYPTMTTSEGAKAFFYEPETMNLKQFNANAPFNVAVSGLKIPNGNGYSTITVANNNTDGWIFNGGTTVNTLATASDVQNITVGSLRYSISTIGTSNVTVLKLQAPSNGVWADVTNPAFGIIEGKDDGGNYNAVVITTKPGTISTNATAVNDILRTWSSDSQFNAITWNSNTNRASDADYFGTTVVKDSGDSNHPYAIINYPKDQVYALVYAGSVASAITPGSSGSSSGGLAIYEDSESDSFQNMNLVVVGGSCVNIAAAKILGSDAPLCGGDFTAKTQVGSDQYIIETVQSPYNTVNVAVLVAGYEAADTTNAVDKLLTGVATDVGSSQVYPIVSTTTPTTPSA
jgi:hypothetical protein